MLTRESRLDQEVVTWLAGLGAALTTGMPVVGDDVAKTVVGQPRSEKPAQPLRASGRPLSYTTPRDSTQTQKWRSAEVSFGRLPWRW